MEEGYIMDEAATRGLAERVNVRVMVSLHGQASLSPVETHHFPSRDCHRRRTTADGRARRYEV